MERGESERASPRLFNVKKLRLLRVKNKLKRIREGSMSHHIHTNSIRLYLVEGLMKAGAL